MIVFLTIVYILLLFVLIKVKVLPDKKWVWLTIIPYELILLIGFFIPMQWGAPAGDLRLLNYSLGITANVPGEVTEVPVKPNVPLKKGDVLFKIDPTLYQAQYDAVSADLKLAKLRLKQARALAKDEAGTMYDVERLETRVNKLQAQLASAKWNLDQTVVRAPSDGYVTFVALRPGQRVSNMPVNRTMAFVDTSENILGSQILQNFSRYIEPGQEAEITFKSRPGKVYKAKVMYMLPITAQGEVRVSGSAARPQNTEAGPFFVRLKLDDQDMPKDLVVGSLGSAAIYTSQVKVTHIIRKVMIRLTSIMNYVMP